MKSARSAIEPGPGQSSPEFSPKSLKAAMALGWRSVTGPAAVCAVRFNTGAAVKLKSPSVATMLVASALDLPWADTAMFSGASANAALG